MYSRVFTMEKSGSRFSLLRELKWRKLSRKPKKGSSCVTGTTGAPHTPALLWTKPCHSEVCRCTPVSGTSWCNTTRECLCFLTSFGTQRLRWGWHGQGRGAGTGVCLPALTPGCCPSKMHCPSPSMEAFLSFRKPSSSSLPLNYFFKLGKKPKQLIGSLLALIFSFFNCFAYS